MGKIFILGNSEKLEQSGYNFYKISDLRTDKEIHVWILNNLLEKDIEKIVIEVGKNPALSLQLGLHIRLTKELRAKALIPILFVSTSSLNAIVVETGIWSHLLATKGIYFSSFDNLAGLKNEITAMEGIAPNDYETGFLNVIKMPDEIRDGHSLANIWGAYTMDKAAKTKAFSGTDARFTDNQAKLYFKYVSAKIKLKSQEETEEADKENTTDTIINASGKKILLIDDESDKGWKIVLEKVFNTSTLQVIEEKVKDYDAFSDESKRIIENEHFDLYIVDLRLNGFEEEKVLKATDFSGMKVLQKIKSLNKGNQVIMFTASNKVWNLKALLDAGADGYYMKESPEYSFSNEFSTQNYKQFQKDVKRCFDRNFLAKIYSEIRTIKSIIKGLPYSQDFTREIENQLDLFWNMISKAWTESDFAYSYVTLYMVIEIINNQFVKKKVGEDKWEIEGVGLLLDWQWNPILKKCDTNGRNKVSEWQKMAGLYFQRWNQKEHKFIRNILFLIQKRNGFVHNDKTILDRKDEKTGKFLNHDVYTKEGVIKLFDAVKQIISFL
ncbi:hypothetical protein AGMMS4957_08580 [Bacteroidia bacterium]|nr:hypothetical protein AGMMS4957_08580 [Bacteroidia bacterium]